MHEIPTVLIVDDDQAICNFVGEVLAEDGYACEIALNAHDALVKMRNQPFDIALLDVRLPDQSGIELLETSQLFSQTTSTIMMTAVKDLDTVVQAMKMGASDYVVKPFTIEKLTASITGVLRNRKDHKLVSIQSAKVEDTNRSRNALG
ncbi:MAG TPA: response regulator, partial [Dehalococcoidia bacterium]